MLRITFVLLWSVCAGTANAHGGQYLGPPANPAVPTPRSPAGPGTGRPDLPSMPLPGVGPATPGGGPGALPDGTTWDVWWEFNKEPWLERQRVDDGPATGSDDYFLGQSRRGGPVDLLRPTEQDFTDRVVPALAGLLTKERNRDIATACLVALGKIGRDAPGVDLETTLAGLLSRDDQEVRETAVLALGIAGRPRAVTMLRALLLGTAEGKAMVQRADVDERTRAFAAYGLGLVARRSESLELRQQVHDLLWAAAQDRDAKTRDLRTAAVGALGLLRPPGARPVQRLIWQSVDELLNWLALDLGRSEEFVQAHGPVAVARLLGRGSSELHQRSKAQFVGLLNGRERVGNPLLQSAALALGELAEAEAPADAEVSLALRQFAERGVDRLARNFALVALGRIGGAANRTWLLQAYPKSNKAIERPWLALALGQCASGALAAAPAAAPDDTVAGLLLEDLVELRNPETRAAVAIGLGMTRHPKALPALVEQLREHEGQERLAGYFAVGLGLLGDRTAVDPLTEVLARSARRPFLMQQTALALGRLGDRRAAEVLVEALRAGESTAVLAAVASALGRVGDRRAIVPLVQMAGDAELTKLARAFVAAALGAICDKDPLRWNVPLSLGSNYAAAVDTLTNGATGVLDIL
ncbi:MAG: HEAT repeat domain-containing protein [Planctomycetes bacterium]|nr:HEAT repeat domain-containing protein [Planctomycetota bacterium]